MQVPKLEKIVLSRGVGAAVSDKKLIDYAVDELTKITGQKRYLHFKERCILN
jgi:large subunit ribosomal protein L5